MIHLRNLIITFSFLLIPIGTAYANTFTVVNSGNNDYLINDVADPALTLYRGRTYIFTINASGHPFWIKTNAVTGTGSAYTNGVTGNGTAVGTLTFVVPTNAPNTLHYICQSHSAMTGTFNISNSPQRAWWRFEDIGPHVLDYSGRSMNGVITNMNPGVDDGISGYSTDVPGALIVDGNLTNANVYSLRFSNTGGVVRILNPSLLALTNHPASVTIEAFVKLNREKHPMRILDARLTNAPPPTFRTTLTPFFAFTGTGQRPRISLIAQSDFTTNVGVTVSGSVLINPSPIALRHWHHVAFVLDNSTISFYVDYQLMDSYSMLAFGYVPGPYGLINQVSLGGIPTDPFANFEGLIDEIRISDRALAPTQFLRVVNGLAPGIRAFPSPEAPASVTVVTEQGIRYQVQGTSHLLPPSPIWTNIGTVITGSLFYTTISTPGAPALIYRAIRNP
ncbi:MAG TPA: hypothetical protein PKE55_01740 [Kiritimatiellia bacterium]|nr:hypothetical protein [Kiritimatiellia bacterium]